MNHSRKYFALLILYMHKGLSVFGLPVAEKVGVSLMKSNVLLTAMRNACSNKSLYSNNKNRPDVSSVFYLFR